MSLTDYDKDIGLVDRISKMEKRQKREFIKGLDMLSKMYDSEIMEISREIEDLNRKRKEMEDLVDGIRRVYELRRERLVEKRKFGLEAKEKWNGMIITIQRMMERSN